MSDLFWKSLVDSISEGVYFVDRTRTITYWNKGAERLSGHPADEVVGSRCQDNLLRHVDDSGLELCESACPLQATMEDGVPRECEVYMRHKDGHRIPVYIRSSPVYEGDVGEISGCVEVFSYNNKEQQICDALNQLGDDRFIDHLTRIANRRHGELMLEAHVQGNCRLKADFGLLMIDIDSFKSVNDRHGHAAGDLVIRTVVKSLSAGLRPLDFLCRWGGEEFVVILPNVSFKRLRAIAERLRMLVAHSAVEVDGSPISVTVSLGGVLSTPTDTAQSVLEKADRHMYHSKRLGKNRVCLG